MLLLSFEILYIYIGYKAFIRYMISKYFFVIYGLYLYSYQYFSKSINFKFGELFMSSFFADHEIGNQKIKIKLSWFFEIKDSLTVVPVVRPGNGPVPWGLSYNPVWFWFCHQHHAPRDLGVVLPTCTLGNRHMNLSQCCRPWSATPFQEHKWINIFLFF